VMGIIPLFLFHWGEANALFYWKISLINKERSLRRWIAQQNIN